MPRVMVSRPAHVRLMMRWWRRRHPVVWRRGHHPRVWPRVRASGDQNAFRAIVSYGLAGRQGQKSGQAQGTADRDDFHTISFLGMTPNARAI